MATLGGGASPPQVLEAFHMVLWAIGHSTSVPPPTAWVPTPAICVYTTFCVQWDLEWGRSSKRAPCHHKCPDIWKREAGHWRMQQRRQCQVMRWLARGQEPRQAGDFTRMQEGRPSLHLPPPPRPSFQKEPALLVYFCLLTSKM